MRNSSIHLKVCFSLFFGIVLLASNAVVQAANMTLTIATPGPGNLLFLPIELAKVIGADAAEGVDLNIRFFGGGPQTVQDMLEGNSDFSACGMPALAQQRALGKPVRSIVAFSRVPAFALMVRSDLKGKVRKIADLKGRVIGVMGHTKTGRSTTQMFTEYMFAKSGLPAGSINFLSVGKSYEGQHAALVSGSVDAIMGDEPFASRLQSQGVAYYLADFHDLGTVRKLMGGLFLNAQMATREDVITQRPEVAEKMVRVMQRTLRWLNQHSATEVADAMGYKDAEERTALAQSLAKYKNIYTPDGAFSDEQVLTTERFYHQVEANDKAAQGLQFKDLIADQWAGRTR